MRLLIPFLFACTGKPADDTGTEVADTDTDTDADSDTDSDTDTDTDPRTASISGSVVYPDGSPAPGVEVQVCAAVCRYLTTDSGGNFEQASLEAAEFKIDAMGDAANGTGYGNALYGVATEVGVAAVVPAPLVLPMVAGPVGSNETSPSRSYTVGDVQLTFAATDLDLPFGAADSETGDFDLYAGVLEGAEVPALWSVTPTFAVSLMPWLTEPTAGFDITVSGLSAPDGAYDVYSLEEYGALESVGTATVSGGVATAAGLQPSVWTWLLFVPA